MMLRKGADARDATGRIVPLYAGASRSGVNPAAVAFSPYGAIVKAASQSPRPKLSPAPRISAGWSKGADARDAPSCGMGAFEPALQLRAEGCFNPVNGERSHRGFALQRQISPQLACDFHNVKPSA